MSDNRKVNVEVNGNKIQADVEHNGNSRGCYTNWFGTWTITGSTRIVTQDDVDGLKEAGEFGRGQVVNATLLANTIKYNGLCDSGG